MMTAGTRGGSVSGAMSFDVALVSVAHASNRPGTGPAVVTVSGLGLGIVLNTMRARAGHTGCESTKWVSETSVVGRLGHGAGSTRRLVMTVAHRGDSLTHAWSEDVTMVSVIRGSNLVSRGSIDVMVHGTRLGLSQMSVRAETGHTACESTDWQSDTTGQ